jgi:hypothetical protein
MRNSKKSRTTNNQSPSSHSIPKPLKNLSLIQPPKDPLNIDLKIDVDIENINERYGIQPKEKLGDIIIESH